MRPSKYLWALSLGLANASEPQNANHIFNAIQSCLRHYESALNPYGMAFHLASVPKGTRFYHGTGKADPIVGVEWLAFKPQHSLGFAHRSGWRREKRSLDEQEPLNSLADSHADADVNDDADDDIPHGYLHTYAAARDLRLLYIDGMSAGPGGSAESQDRILFNDTIHSPAPGPRPPVGGPPAEKERAFQTCRMVEEVWGERIDGVVRTEGDFEIILCRFERDLEVVGITQTRAQDGPGFGGPRGGKGKGRPGKGGKGRGGPGGGLRGPVRGDCCSIAAKYDQLLGHKVHLDFDHFVSAFSYGLDLFPAGSDWPVLDHIPTELLEPIRRDINDMVNSLEPAVGSFDWQAVADMIVFRYSDELQTLAAGNFSSAEALHERLEGLLEPFIDYRHFGAKGEIIHLCENEFIPGSAPVQSVGGRVVSSISRSICSTLASGLLDEKDLDETVASFKQLVEFLDWTTWKGQ
jgi:hypothetical protein